MEFILALYKHRSFGWLIRPALADKPDSSGKRAVERFVLGVAETAGIVVSESMKRILEHIDSISDQELTRRFSPRGVSMSEFLRNPDPKRTQELILPFIWKQVDQILREAKKTRIPVCLVNDNLCLYPEMYLETPEAPAEPVFCFSKGAEYTRYILEVRQEDHAIDLQGKNTFLMASEPCWLCAGNKLLHFPDGFDGKKLQPFLAKKELLIPASAEKEYFRKFILKIAKTGEIKAEGFTVRNMKPEPRLILSPELNWLGNAVFVIYYYYGENRILAGKKQRVFTSLEILENEITINRTERDFAWESSRLNDLLDLGFLRINENTLNILGSSLTGNLSLYELVEWINRYSEILRDMGVEIETNRLPERYFTGSVSSDFRVESGKDWFDVTAVVHFGDIAVPFRELRKYLLEGIREFPLPGGEIAILPAEWFTRFRDLLWFARDEGEKFRLNSRHFSVILEMNINITPDTNERLDELDAGLPGNISIPDTLRATLRPYQEGGFRWLRFLAEHRFGGCLADDMGLGKTIQALTILLSTKEPAQPASLIVMPASLIHNWIHEIDRFAPDLRVMSYTGIQRAVSTGFFDSVDVILTTYGIMRADLDLLSSYRFHYVILDESQFIKNPEALTSQAACQLQSDHRLVLTGTPIENSLSDLWSQMEFLNPGLLGPLASFRKRFMETEKNILETADGEPVRRLKRIIAPFILRRTKQEVEKDLPPLVIEDWYCDMSEEQEKQYETEKSAIRNEILQQIETGDSPLSNVSFLRALIRLRQIANHPSLVDPDYPGSSGKFEEVIRIAEILQEEGHKVLIFSSFVKHLNLLSSWFDDQRIIYSMLTGASVHRDRIIRQFQDDPDNHFFLISLKAGGTGLNLTQASYVMLLDPWWNPASELQAINRAHRIGQDKKVIAYKFITENTIEEKMLKLQQRKQVLSDTVIPSVNPLKNMAQEEIIGFFE